MDGGGGGDTKMGCLYGQMMNFVRSKYRDNDEFKDSADWNLLVMEMALWIFQRSPEFQIRYHPYIPDEGGTTPWSVWFWRGFDAMCDEFNDATPSLVYGSLKNCPHEDVARIVFDTIDIDDIKLYLGSNGCDIKLL